jgi:hypothetical protein
MKALSDEYTNRYGKVHKSMEHYETFLENAHYIPEGKLTPFVNCTPYKEMEVIPAYRKYMQEKWNNDKRTPKWNNGERPTWP